MTCCLALRTRQKDGKLSLLVAGDSASCESNEVMTVTDPKVFESGDYVMAYAGDFRLGQVLKYQFVPPTPPKDSRRLMKFMVTEFVVALAETIKKSEFLQKDQAISLGDSEIIVATRKRVFLIQQDLSVLEMSANFMAIGAGKEYALGSLHTSAAMQPEARVTRALEAAGFFCPWVKPPYTSIACT